MYSVEELSEIIKAYDIRGLVETQLTPNFVESVGAAFAELVKSEGVDTIIVGHDMRDSSPVLADKFMDGVINRGVNVVNIGLVSTDGLYFASGKWNLPGAMFTASHNPASYNGIKLCRAGARPIGANTGLDKIIAYLAEDNQESVHTEPVKLGKIKQVDALDEYRDYMLNLVDISKTKHLTIAVDAGNGMAGHVIPKVFAEVPNITIKELFFELDGSFPNHEANPLDPKNLVDLEKYIKNNSCDLGLAFDGDADRCFIIDEKGEAVSPSIVAALVAEYFLSLNPGATIIHNLITSNIVPETIKNNGGTPIRTRVGHSFIKQSMSENKAVFGGEHSGHYYFKDFWNADSGLLAALIVIKILGESDKSLSELVKPFEIYSNSGEINTKVSNPELKVKEVVTSFADSIVKQDELDGTTVILDDGSWFNLRLSNTESLLRLNVEAANDSRVKEIVKQVTTILNAG